MTRPSRNDSEHLQGMVDAAGSELSRSMKIGRLADGNHQFKGGEHEAGLRSFLRGLLPSGMRVGTGFAFDALGKRSRQLDVLVSSESPLLLSREPDTPVVLPCEHLLAVVEVKSTLTKGEIRKSVENATSVQSLAPYGNGKFVPGRKRGEEVKSGEHRVQYTVFALASDLKGDEDYIAGEWSRYRAVCSELGVAENVIDRILVPGRALIDAAHADGYGVDSASNLLGLWFVHLFNHLQREVVRRPPMNLNAYTLNKVPARLDTGGATQTNGVSGVKRSGQRRSTRGPSRARGHIKSARAPRRKPK